MSAIELGFLFHSCNFSASFAKSNQKLLADIGVRHLTTAEAHSDLNTIAFLEEFHRVSHLRVEVVCIDARGHTNLFDLNNTLVFLSFLFPLELVKTELAVIHNFTDRRHGIRGDFDEVKLLLLCHLKRSLRSYDSEHSAIRTNQTNFLVPNLLIELMI